MRIQGRAFPVIVVMIIVYVAQHAVARQFFAAGSPTVLLLHLIVFVSLPIAVLVANSRGIFEAKQFMRDAIIGTIVLWGIALALVPMYLPVTSFQARTSPIDIFQFLRLGSISMFQTGLSLILIIFVRMFREGARPRRSENGPNS